MRHPWYRTILAVLVGVALMLVPAGSVSAETQSTAAAPAASHPRPEALRLRCRGVQRDGRNAVVCDWSAAGSGEVVGYRLRRGGDGQRVTVARTPRTQAVDRHIRPGVRYRYRVVALNAAGRIVGHSRVVGAGVPAPAG